MGFALAIGASNGPPRLGGASPYHGFLNHQSSLLNPTHIGETPVEPRSCGRPMGFAFAIGASIGPPRSGGAAAVPIACHPQGPNQVAVCKTVGNSTPPNRTGSSRQCALIELNEFGGSLPNQVCHFLKRRLFVSRLTPGKIRDISPALKHVGFEETAHHP